MKVGKEQPGIMDKLRRAVPVSHVQGGAANEPGVRCQGDGDIQPGNSQAHEVQPDQQECQDGPQEPDDQDHVPGAREGHEGAHQGVQQDDGDGQSSKYQGDAQQDGGDSLNMEQIVCVKSREKMSVDQLSMMGVAELQSNKDMGNSLCGNLVPGWSENIGTDIGQP